MPRIGRFPPFGKRFFRRARKMIGSCHFAHFWRVVVAIAAMHGRRSLRRIEQACRNHHTRQSIGFFLTRAQWDAPEMLRQTALDTLKHLGWKPRHRVYVIVDDTQKRKRGKRMDAVSKIFLHAEKVYAQGHTIVGCALLYPQRGDSLRRALVGDRSILRRNEEVFLSGRSDSVSQADRTGGGHDFAGRRASRHRPVRLLLPLSAGPPRLQGEGYRFVGVAKKNRNFFPDGRLHDKRRLSKYGANVLRRDGRWFATNGKKHRLATRVGQLSKSGRVKLVFSRRAKEQAWIAMATNETRWSASTILSHYLNRWPIEVLFKESKQYLGLGDYQVLRYRGIERYLHLVLIAHLLLTHLGANEPGAQADCDENDPLRLPSVPRLQQLLRSKLWDDTINTMEKGSRNRRVGKKLKEIIQL